MRTRRWSEIDNLYALGIVLVVFGHSHSSDWSSFSGTILEAAISFIYIFHMPLFFFIAGFLFMNSSSLERIGYEQWVKQKAKRLLIPYVVLSAVALIPKYYIENQSFAGFTSYLIKAIFVPRIGVWGHFWFLPVLMLVYLLFGLIRLYVTDKLAKMFVGGGTAVLAVVLYFLPYSTEWFGFSDFKENIIFFTLGMSLNCCKSTSKRTIFAAIRILWIVVGTMTSIMLFHSFFEVKVVMLITAIIMISVSWQIAVFVGENNVCRWISSNNLTIYIYSWPFQAVTMAIASKLGFSWFQMTLSMFVVGMTTPILMMFIYKKLKVLNNRFFDLLLGMK